MATKDLTLSFGLLEVGTNSQVEIVPESESPAGLPFTTLPIGLPPILPDLKEELEEKFIKSIDQLPIHELERVQQLWPRKSEPSSLYHVEQCPLQTTIVVDRNPTTGQLLGYKEAYTQDCGISAKNSMSLKRQPGPLTEALRGSATNRPFWPGIVYCMTDEVSAFTLALSISRLYQGAIYKGGLEEPSLEGPRDTTLLEDIDFEKDLLEVAPGFARGVVFEKKALDKLTTAPRAPGGVIHLRDIMAQEDDIFFEPEDNAELQEGEKVVEEDKQSANESSHVHDNIDDIIKLEHREEDLLDSQQTKQMSEQKEEWAVKVDINTPVHDFYKRIPDMAYTWPFELDVFQKQAILHLENHENVFVAAHTSAGKTVIAEYAIALSMKHCTRTVYTSPIKALSNQKFRDFKTTFESVGLVTGDVQINQDASCLIMTTEILRSMLYNGSDVIRDLEWVIFDEVHYINDAERGVVWEEVLIMLPQHVNIILLSATVPNTLEFADWIGRTKKRKVFVVSTTKRPVPLEHYLYTGNSNKTSTELFMIVDANKNFLTAGYHKALDAKKERASKSSQSYGAKGTRGGNPHQDKNVWLSVIDMLRKKDKLPIVAFTFSKRRIEENANNLGSVDLTTQSEKSEVHIFFQKCISRLKGSDKELPQVLHMQHLLKRGIGVHHSGILPILKEVVEMLFQKGLVKILFATETFAMGVNMPARTVVFDTIRKHDGTNFRDLLPGEYIQMAGRAGRRGLDTTGTVIILCKGDVPEMAELHKMMLGKPTLLQSQFRLTYSMILNLLRVEQLRVEDMMKRSFSEFHNQKDVSRRKETLQELSQQVENLEEVLDYTGDLEEYYTACDEYWSLKHELQGVMLTHPQAIKSLSAGRVLVIDNSKFQNTLGVVLQGSPSGSKERSFTVLVICETKLHTQQELNNSTSSNSAENENEDSDLLYPKPVIANQLFHPEGPCGHEVIKVKSEEISAITVKTLKINADRIVDDFKKRQMPRFKHDPPGQSTVTATQELLRLVESNPTGLSTLEPVKDLHIRDVDMVESFRRLAFLHESFPNYRCVHDPCFMDNFKKLKSNMKVKEDFRQLTFLLSDASLQLLPEYQQRIQVLHQLSYIDTNKAIQLKGRVACEISQHELIITELVFENLLTSLHPAEIAAILSCVVFEQKNCGEPNLNPDLVKAKTSFLETAEKIGNIQKDCGLRIPVQDYIDSFHFGLLEVVFEWARGMPFSEITSLTDVQEGIIVRCIQRLDEVLKDVRNAARLIGDPVLYQKMEEASGMIKRDIVFAASLYTQ